MTLNDCPICQKQGREFPLPGGALWEDDLVFASLAHLQEGQLTVYLGWLVIETRRHIPTLPDLSEAEGAAVGRLAVLLSQALREILSAEHVYAFVIGHGVAHFHLHLLPRYPGTPREYWGMRLDEWPAASRGNANQIEALCNQIRAWLANKTQL